MSQTVAYPPPPHKPHPQATHETPTPTPRTVENIGNRFSPQAGFIWKTSVLLFPENKAKFDQVHNTSERLCTGFEKVLTLSCFLWNAGLETEF